MAENKEGSAFQFSEDTASGSEFESNVIEHNDVDVLVDSPSDSVGDVRSDDTPSPQESQAPAVDQSGQAAPFFEYRGRTFASGDELSQYMGSWEGRVKAATSAYDQIARYNEEWVNWSRDPEKVKKHLESLSGTSTAPEVKADTASEPGFAGLPTAVWTKAQELLEKGEGMKALQFINWANQQAYDAKLKSIKDEMSGLKSLAEKPVLERAEQSARQDQYMELFQWAYNATDYNGELLYPELNESSPEFNPEFVQGFAAIYKSLDPATQLAPNGAGVDLAYLQTKRMWDTYQGSLSQTAESIRNEVADRVRDAQGRFVSTSRAAQGAVGSSLGNNPAKAVPESYREAQSIRDSLDGPIEKDKAFGIRR